MSDDQGFAKPCLVLVIMLSVAGMSGCATISRPAYCDAMLDQHRAAMAAKSDFDVAFIGTALSRVTYGGECACPTDHDSAGDICGDRSAYSRAGGAVLACAPEDIPKSALPGIREHAAVQSLPVECGGSGISGFLEF